MSAAITDRPRRLAPAPAVRFERDDELAIRLGDGQRRPRRAIDLLWWGLHRGGMAGLCEHASGVEVGFANDSSGVLAAPDAPRAARQVHRTVGRSFAEYQHASEGRRQRAAEVGEPIAVLVSAGWSDREALARGSITKARGGIGP